MFKKVLALALIFAFFMVGCAQQASEDTRNGSFVTKLADLNSLGKGQPVVVQDVPHAKWAAREMQTLPIVEDFQCDVRNCNINSVNLYLYKEKLKFICFDMDTVWPADLPEGFYPSKIMEIGKNPGLGIKQLHAQGITGKGVNIAIIDLELLLDHDEYAQNIVLYEMIHSTNLSASMHGAAVTSLAVGKTTGVAPDAKVNY